MAGNTQVSLSWTASSGATSYRIKRATVSGGPYTIIATNSTTSYTNTGLVNGTAYYYVVSAVNAVGESPNSAQVSSTPNAGSLPPAPMGLTAALTGNNTDVRLNWTAVAGATSYKVKRAAINGGPYTLVASPTTNTYTDTSSKTQGTTYYYVVSVVNATGEGPNSAQVSIVP
jgi:fibronectin type 3 domain-containing protein